MKLKSRCFGFKSKYVWNVPNEEKKPLREKENRWTQCATFSSIILMSLGISTAEMWMTPALPYLKSDDFKFPVSDDEISWVVSIFPIGEIIGFLLYPLFIDRIGRKNTLLLFSMPQILSCALILMAQNVITLYLGRIIGGLGFGAGIVVQVIYVNEIAEKDTRGLLMSISRLAFLIGSIFIILAGAFFSYDTMNLIVLLVQPIYILPFIYVPESPYFYLKLHREEEATESLSRLRKNLDSKAVNLEIKRMKEDIVEDEKNKKFALRNIFENKRHRRAFIIVGAVKLGVVFSGSTVIGVYFQDIFSYTGLSLPPQYASVILVSIVAVGIVPVILLVEFVDRRVMILCSSIICSLSLMFLGFFFFLKNYIQVDDLSSISWTPLVAFVVLEVSLVALLCTSLVLSGEIFSSQVKSTALAILHVKSKVLEILIKLSFESSVRILDMYGVFWIYSVACLSFSLIGFFVAPETRGKSLEEIQLLLD